MNGVQKVEAKTNGNSLGMKNIKYSPDNKEEEQEEFFNNHVIHTYNNT